MPDSATPSSGWPKKIAVSFGKKLMAFWEDEKNKEDYENPDNFRECRIGNKEEEDAFKLAEEAGCCGAFDIEWDLDVTPPVKVRYGFNYGH